MMGFTVGYASQPDLYPPRTLLEHAILAEKAGFETLWVSDHFHPWSHSGAHGGHTWVIIAAAAAQTRSIRFGTAVTCPLFRYNPAITAQAFATLSAMFPGRIFVGVGTGEAMNEIPVGYDWPSAGERIERLEEAIRIMRLLWSRNFVTFKGKYYRLRKANLYTKPEAPIPLYVAAFGPKVAKIAGKYADGFLTSLVEPNRLRNVLLKAVAEGAKETGRDFSEIERVVEINIAYDEDYTKALKKVRFWAANLFPFMFKLPIYDPREIEEMGKLVSDEAIAKAFFIGTKPDDIIAPIERAVKMGFDHVYLQSTSPDEDKFFEIARKHVVPYVKSTYGKPKQR
jgi:coenzyme F420-dependent glucose-6-phosphate dehydrogenase